jgi:glycerophosphoryl diester phosphodiesterase
MRSPPDRAPVLGFAHRGGGHGPDNALETFAAALALGASGLETDAWLSRDGHVVLDHDGVADPASGQPISDVARDQLPAHMATLEDLYESCGTDFALAVDVKTTPVATAMVDVAKRYGAADNLWVVMPETSARELAALEDGHRAITIRGEVLRSHRRRDAALTAAAEINVEAINARWMWWSRSIVGQVHRLGMNAFGYDAQHAFSLRRSVRLGLDGVFCDHVDRMLAALDP